MDENGWIFLQAILLGVIQGFTEFLPVSSSAHLLIVPKLFHMPYFGKSFDVLLHGGTLAAVIISRWPTVREMLSGAGDYLRLIFSSQRGAGLPKISSLTTVKKRLGVIVCAAAVPAAALGFLLEHRVERFFHGLPCLAAMLVLFGLLMAYCDKNAGRERELASLGWWQALCLGLSQALALIPGVSRSGAVLTMARCLHIERRDAAELSFLLSLPVVGGALLVKIIRGFDLPSADLILPALVGVGAAYITGCWALSFLEDLATRKTLRVFAVYRILLAAVLLTLYIIG